MDGRSNMYWTQISTRYWFTIACKVLTEIIPLFHISLDDKMVMEAQAYSLTNWTKSSMVLTVKSARYEDLVVEDSLRMFLLTQIQWPLGHSMMDPNIPITNLVTRSTLLISVLRVNVKAEVGLHSLDKFKTSCVLHQSDCSIRIIFLLLHPQFLNLQVPLWPCLQNPNM